MQGKGRNVFPSGAPDAFSARQADGARPTGAPSSGPEADLVGTRLGNFVLESVLGRGRMGVVYLARDEALRRPTAVKVLSWKIPPQDGQDPEEWFLGEARAMALINHPSVAQVYGVARHQDRCYIAMEYVVGSAADASIARHGPMPSELATSILVQAARAVQAAHAVGVVHGDVKPENLIVATNGAAKLVDFGMARSSAAIQTAFSGRTGTPFYTAPELWRGEAPGRSADIYALGVTYFYLLTGRPPLTGKDIPSLRAAHLEGTVPDVEHVVSGVPAACGRIVQRCLAKAVRDRYPSADMLCRDAQTLFAELRAART
jgi:urea transport system substrate-binding protein